MSERFLRVKELAALLGVKHRTLIEYRHKGRLTLPLEKKSGMLGCKESVYATWLQAKEGVC
jgi:predicted DNA-binding transcriptional regulator AlpA